MTSAKRLAAHQMLTAQGQTVTLTRRTGGSYDVATLSATITTSTQTGKGVIFDFPAGLRKAGNTNIPAGARECYLSALNTAGTVLTRPEVDDLLTDAGGTIYTVSGVSELAPAGVDIMYILVLEANV